MNPGATVFGVMPNGASSRAQLRVRPICALLAVAPADLPGGGRWATSKSMCTIRYCGHQESGPEILTRVRWGEGGGAWLGRGVRLWSSKDQEATAMSGEAHPVDDITYSERDAPVPGLQGQPR